jgi:arthrofactin-type cyclic lipopeptide synthetase A
VERVGRHDNFFELGGHSLLIIVIIERMREKKLNADVRILFLAQTLAKVAVAVNQGSTILEIPANRIPTQAEKSSSIPKIQIRI